LTACSASTSFVVTVRGVPAQLDDILALGLPHSLEVKLEHAAGLLGAATSPRPATSSAHFSKRA